MIDRRSCALAWALAGLLLVALSVTYVTGVALPPRWPTVVAALAAAVAAVLLRPEAGHVPSSVGRWVLVGGWGLTVLGLVLWVGSVVVLGALALVVGGLALAVAVLTHAGLGASTVPTVAAGVGSAVVGTLGVIQLPTDVGLALLGLAGATLLAAGLAALRARHRAWGELRW